MSYNISSVKVQMLDNLQISLSDLYTTDRKDWLPAQPKILDAATMRVSIEGGGGQTIKGILKDGVIFVDELNLSGEGSGTYMHEVIIPALQKSTGIFEAILIWEGGDTVERFTVTDGTVEEENVQF